MWPNFNIFPFLIIGNMFNLGKSKCPMFLSKLGILQNTREWIFKFLT